MTHSCVCAAACAVALLCASPSALASSSSAPQWIVPVSALAAVPPSLDAGPPFASIVARHAAANDIPVALAHAVISVESNYRPNVRGSAGEVGLMQIKPATARLVGYSGGASELFDPEVNIRYGMRYLGKARKLGGGTTCGTILKYNAGHGARRMNPVSRAYCSKVLRLLAKS